MTVNFMKNKCFLSSSRPEVLTDVIAYLFLILALLRSDRDTVVFGAVAAAIGILAIVAIVRSLLRLRMPAPEVSDTPQRREEFMRRGIRMAAYFGLLAVILRDIPAAVFVGAVVVAFLLAAVAIMALFSRKV